MKKASVFRRVVHKVPRILYKAAPTILSCIAAAGTVGTAILAVKASKKVDSDIKQAEEKKNEPLTVVEKARIVVPAYAPSFLMGTATVASIFGSNALSIRQKTAILGAYTVLDQGYKEYRDKMRELHGEEADREVLTEIAHDHHPDEPLSNDDVLFYEPISDQYFWRTMLEVKDAEYNLNRNFILRGYTSLNELYQFYALPPTEKGDMLGWSDSAGFEFYGYSWIDFIHKLHESDDPDTPSYYEICYPFPPTTDYLSLDYGA